MGPHTNILSDYSKFENNLKTIMSQSNIEQAERLITETSENSYNYKGI